MVEMPGKYVPPHLRRAGLLVAPAQEKKRGVKWPSNATGDPAANVKHHRYTVKAKRTPTRAEKAKEQSRRLARRVLRPNAHTRKGLLKGKKAKRQVLSASTPLKKRRTLKAATK